MSRAVTPMLAIVVLSSLDGAPTHAYELKKHLAMGIGRFMRVTDGTLYPLLRELEEAGSIASHTEAAEHRRPDRVVYAITDAGREDLRARLAAPLAEGPAGAVDFYVRVVCFPHIEPDGRRGLIEERRGRVHRELGALAEARAQVAEVSGHPELADLRARQLHAELEWLDDLERTVPSTGGLAAMPTDQEVPE